MREIVEVKVIVNLFSGNLNDGLDLAYLRLTVCSPMIHDSL